MPAHHHRFRPLAALLAVAALAILPACGDDGDDDEETTTAAATTAAPATTAETEASADAATTAETETSAETETTVAEAETATSADTGTTAPADTSAPGTAAAAPDEEAVRAAVQDYLDAFAAKDGSRACDLLTEEAEQAFLDAIQGQTDCATAFQTAAEQAGDLTLQALGLAEIGPVTVDGDSATTSVGVLGMEQQVTLERVDGEWKVASLPGTPGQ